LFADRDALCVTGTLDKFSAEPHADAVDKALARYHQACYANL